MKEFHMYRQLGKTNWNKQNGFSRKVEDRFVETRKVLYDVDNECVIYVQTPQSDKWIKQRRFVDADIPEWLYEETKQWNPKTKCNYINRGSS